MFKLCSAACRSAASRPSRLVYIPASRLVHASSSTNYAKKGKGRSQIEDEAIYEDEIEEEDLVEDDTFAVEELEPQVANSPEATYLKRTSEHGRLFSDVVEIITGHHEMAQKYQGEAASQNPLSPRHLPVDMVTELVESMASKEDALKALEVFRQWKGMKLIVPEPAAAKLVERSIAIGFPEYPLHIFRNRTFYGFNIPPPHRNTSPSPIVRSIPHASTLWHEPKSIAVPPAVNTSELWLDPQNTPPFFLRDMVDAIVHKDESSADVVAEELSLPSVPTLNNLFDFVSFHLPRDPVLYALLLEGYSRVGNEEGIEKVLTAVADAEPKWSSMTLSRDSQGALMSPGRLSLRDQAAVEHCLESLGNKLVELGARAGAWNRTLL